ncbi:MAG: hypothetical protein B7Z15_13590 [Rhizobiales bacterium 32-66-8]|nr:MAG: hypothetical protein B7Z15_13590 [Rhizobiales bacterium 32-66-8]
MMASLTAPALAHDHGSPVAGPGQWQGSWTGTWNGAWSGAPQSAQGYPAPTPMSYPQQAEPDARTRDMLDRCQRTGPRSSAAGTIIGGVVGGVIGNRVIEGNRTLGTIGGAAVGAVAGRAIDKAADAAADRALDRDCEEFFRTYSPQGYGPGYGPQGGYPGYGYAPYGYMMVPVMIQNDPQKPCVETRTTTVEYVPVRSRYIPRRPVVRDKRVKEKRVYTGS